MVGFIIGVFLGGFIGVALMALLFVSKETTAEMKLQDQIDENLEMQCEIHDLQFLLSEYEKELNENGKTKEEE